MPDTDWTPQRILRYAASALLVIASMQVVLPFIGALAWAAIIAISTWPLFNWLTRRVGNRPRLAATLCSLGLVVVVVGPLVILASTLGHSAPQAAKLVDELVSAIPPETPGWLAGLPLVGGLIEEAYLSVVSDTAGALRNALPAPEAAGLWALSQGARLTLAILEFLFAILVAGVLLVTSEHSVALARQLVTWLDVGDGDRIIDVVFDTVRSVSLGVVGTAAIQSLVAAVGFLIAGAPVVALLAILTFMIALLQLPTPIVWAPVAAWLYVSGEPGPALFLAIYGVAVISVVDNVVRPYLISRGAQQPFALILMGVLGGILAWGIIGMFIGPTLLAVVYAPVRTWIDGRQSGATTPGAA
jgi:predicted PurR-regulated permease PerM